LLHVLCALCADKRESEKRVAEEVLNIGKLYANVDCIHLTSTQQIE